MTSKEALRSCVYILVHRMVNPDLVGLCGDLVNLNRYFSFLSQHHARAFDRFMDAINDVMDELAEDEVKPWLN